MEYALAQLLSLVFYAITLATYNRVRREYAGGKIGAALSLITIFMAVLLLADAVDYFLPLALPAGTDIPLILKIMLKLLAMGVLFFGGLRFVVSGSAPAPKHQGPAPAAPAGTSARIATDPPPGKTDTARRPDPETTKPTLGRYQIIGPIGRGASGIVYKGIDPKLQRSVAIKTIRFSDDFDAEQLENVRTQFYREAQVLAKLSHPNIVAVYDVGEDLDLTYLAMEYLEGETLEAYTRADHRLPIVRCCQIVAQICAALGYLHEHDIIHRDIKPSNIMLLRDGQVKLADFGIARATTLGTRTATGIIKGTPYYMSPEQVQGQPLTGASDIFSLGVVFYQLIAGHLPFSGENLSAVLYQITNAEPRPLSELDPYVAPAVANVLDRALCKDLARRYATAREMAADLNRFAGTAATAPVAQPPEAKEKDPARRDAGVTERAAVQQRHAFTATDGGSPAVVDSHPDSKFGRLTQIAARLTAPMQQAQSAPKAALILVTAAVVVFGTAFLLVNWRTRMPRPAPSVNPTARFVQRVEMPPATSRPSAVPTAAPATTPPVAPPRALLQETDPTETATQEGASKTPERALPTQPVEPETIAGPAPAPVPGTPPAANPSPSSPPAAGLSTASPAVPAASQGPSQSPQAPETPRKPPEAPTDRQPSAALARQAQQNRLDQEAAMARQAQQLRLQQEAAAAKELAVVAERLVAAERLLSAAAYKQGKAAYEGALAIIQTSPYHDLPAYNDYRDRIRSALKRDEIVYGANGYVRYQDRWLSPEAADQARLKDGYVRHRGQFVHYRQLRSEIEAAVQPRVRAILNARYKGKIVHRQQIDLDRFEILTNTLQQAQFVVRIRWEVWTFDTIDKQVCELLVSYDANQDQWQTAETCR